jgi:hypothetical protein
LYSVASQRNGSHSCNTGNNGNRCRQQHSGWSHLILLPLGGEPMVSRPYVPTVPTTAALYIAERRGPVVPSAARWVITAAKYFKGILGRCRHQDSSD